MGAILFLPAWLGLLPYEDCRAGGEAVRRSAEYVVRRFDAEAQYQRLECRIKRDELRNDIAKGVTKTPNGANAADELSGLESALAECQATCDLISLASVALDRLFPRRPSGKRN